MTAPSREPTEAMRLLADELYELWRIRNKIDWCNAAARALAEQDTAARREGFEQAREALAVELSHRAFLCHTHDDVGKGRELGLLDGVKYARALTPEPPSEKENEGG